MPLGLTAAMSATDPTFKKKLGTTALIISKDNENN